MGWNCFGDIFVKSLNVIWISDRKWVSINSCERAILFSDAFGLLLFPIVAKTEIRTRVISLRKGASQKGLYHAKLTDMDIKNHWCFTRSTSWAERGSRIRRDHRWVRTVRGGTSHHQDCSWGCSHRWITIHLQRLRLAQGNYTQPSTYNLFVFAKKVLYSGDLNDKKYIVYIDGSWSVPVSTVV